MNSAIDKGKVFDETYNKIINEYLPQLFTSDTREVLEWFKKVMDYNVPHGKRNRGLSVVSAFCSIRKEKNATKAELESVCVLGWIVEMVQAYMLVADDVMDHAITRRGRECWYRKKGVGLIAVNDALLLESVLYGLLQHFFSSKTYYIKVLHLLLESIRLTTYGQCLDMLASPDDVKSNLKTFTAEKYLAIAKNKTAFYSYCLPIRLGLYAALVTDDNCHKDVEKLLVKMGQLFQIQDDFLDNFGDPKVMGKIGTDIIDGKCTWLITTAMNNSDEKQRKVLEENYGVNSKEAESAVKKIFDEMNLKDMFYRYEENMYRELKSEVQLLHDKHHLPLELFDSLLEGIFRRKK